MRVFITLIDGFVVLGLFGFCIMLVNIKDLSLGLLLFEGGGYVAGWVMDEFWRVGAGWVRSKSTVPI